MFTYSNDSLSHAARAVIDSLYEMSSCREHVIFLDVLEAIKNASDSQLQHEIMTYYFDSEIIDSDYNSIAEYAIDMKDDRDIDAIRSFVESINIHIEEAFMSTCHLFEMSDSDISNVIFDSVTFNRMFCERIA